jgi:basic membrane lipoprotein Med (substrate-binding protein (PBP1-ABC) superfamily)
MEMVNRLVLILALTIGSAIAALAQQAPEKVDKPAPPKSSEARAEVLVLGVYHMANPGRDVFNMQADDVLAPKRQAELTQLMEVLKKFQPTKIAIEADMWGERRQEYSDYLAGKLLRHHDVRMPGNLLPAAILSHPYSREAKQ